MKPIDIHTIIHCLEKNLQDIQGIYLFGSFASGDANKESDVDIAVLCPKRLPWPQHVFIMEELSLVLNRDIDLVELRYVNTIFQEEIIKTAQRIATVDRMACEQYEDYIYCSAMDFREFRKAHVNEIIARGSVYG